MTGKQEGLVPPKEEEEEEQDYEGSPRTEATTNRCGDSLLWGGREGSGLGWVGLGCGHWKSRAGFEQACCDN